MKDVVELGSKSWKVKPERFSELEFAVVIKCVVNCPDKRSPFCDHHLIGGLLNFFVRLRVGPSY